MTPVGVQYFLVAHWFCGLWRFSVSGRLCGVPVLWCPVGCVQCRSRLGPVYIRNIYTVLLYIYQFTWRYLRYLRVFTGTYFGTYR